MQFCNHWIKPLVAIARLRVREMMDREDDRGDDLVHAKKSEDKFVLTVGEENK